MTGRPLHVMLTNGTLFGGGAEHIIGTLARQLRLAGHRVTVAVLTSGGEVQQELQQEGFDVLPNIAGEAGGVLAMSSRLAQIAKERAVDVVHTHDLRSLIDVGISRLRHRSFRHMHTFHFGNYPHVPWRHLMMERLFARVPDQIVAVGNVQRDTIIDALRLAPQRIRTIWNGVDRDHGDTAGPPLRPVVPVPVVGSISTMGPQKGLPTLLEAASLVKQRGIPFKLILAGEGDMRPGLQQQAIDLGLGDTVSFTGWLPDAAQSLLPTLDVFVQSSYWEAMPVVILEAMAAKRAIVATTVGENPHVLSHGETALMVPPREAAPLADALASVLQDAALRQRLAENAFRAYATKFTGEAMAARYVDAYRQLS